MKQQGPCTLALVKRSMLEGMTRIRHIKKENLKAFVQEILVSAYYISGTVLTDGDTILKNSNLNSILAKNLDRQN